MLVELAVTLRILFFHIGQGVEDFFGDALFDHPDDFVVLEDFPADVERQVGRFDHPLDEAQVRRQHRLAVIHDLHPAHVKGRADLVILIEDVEGPLLGEVEERRELGRPFGPVVDDAGGIGEIVGNVFVKLVVLLLADLGLILQPDRFTRIEGLGFGFLDGLLLVLRIRLAAGHLHHHRVVDEIGVLLDDLAQLPFFEVLPGVFLEVKDDVGAATVLLALLQGVAAVGIGLPDHRLVGGSTGAPGPDGDLIGDHEGRVETDPELADQFGIVLDLPALQQLDELLGPRVGNGPEGLHRLIPGHADAVVAHRQGAGGRIGDQLDLPVAPLGVDRGVGQRQVAGLVDGVRGVGDQFAQEDLLVRVEGMDHQVEDLVDLGFELALAHRHVP